MRKIFLNVCLLLSGLCLGALGDAFAAAPTTTNCATAAKPDPTYSTSTRTHVIYLPGIGEDFIFTNSTGTFVQYSNGTAQLTGTVFSRSQPQKGFAMNVQLSGYRTSPPSGSPKKDLSSSAYSSDGPVDTGTWAYYTSLTGTLTGLSNFAGAVVSLTRTGPAFQLGFGANGKNLNYGASSWLNYSVTKQPDSGGSFDSSGDGDIDIDLFPCSSVTNSTEQCVTNAAPEAPFATSSRSHAVYLPGIATDFVFIPAARFTQNSDGTASVAGLITSRANSRNAFQVSVQLGGFTTNTPPGSPKKQLDPDAYIENGGPVNPATWSYYTTLKGTLTGVSNYAGAVLAIDRTGPAFQLGFGANGKNLRFGASSWFVWDVTHQPNSGGSLTSSGQGDFDFDLFDCNGGSGTNQPPVARDDTYATPFNRTLTINPPGVLTNDSDANGDALSAALASNPAHGTLAFNTNGSFVYAPATNFIGIDAFTYRARDGSTTSSLATVTITTQPPSIIVVTPRSGDVICVGDSVTANVAATGPGLTFQWLFGTNILANETNSFLALTNIDLSDAGTYCVIIQSVGGQAVTNCATLVVGTNTVVTTPPTNQVVCVGGNAQFNVAALGNGLVYQWFFAGAPLNGQNASTLLLTNVGAGQAGTYTVFVAGQCGPPITNSATLTVSPNVAITNSPAAQTNFVGSNVVFTVGANGAGLQFQWFFNGLLVGTNSTLTLTNIATNQAGIYCVVVSGSCGGPVTNCTTLVIPNRPPVVLDDNFSTAQNALLTVPAPGVLANDSDADGNALTSILFSNVTHGTLVFNSNGSFNYRPATNFIGVDTFFYRASDGSSTSGVARVTITVQASSIVIVTPPVNQTNCVGSTVMFSVVATGSSLTYQWLFGTNVLVGQTNGTLVLSNVAAVNAGAYCVIVASPGSPSLTNCAVLVVNQNIVIATPPANQAVCSNGTALFTINAAGTVLNYQWFFGGAPLANQTNGALVVSNVTANQTGTYSVVINGPCGSPVTNSATLTLNQNTTIVSPALDQTNFVGSNVVFNVGAAGAGLQFQWFFNGALVSTNSMLALTNIAANQAGIYCVVVSGTCGGPVTNCVTLTIPNRPPVANNDNFTTVQNGFLAVAMPGVLANDVDADGNPLTSVLVSNVSHGTLIFSTNGSFTYRPATNFIGVDAFSYRANDGSALSVLAIVQITVTPATNGNRTPIANGESYSTVEDIQLVIGAPGVLANDSDPDGDTVTALLVAGPTNGTLVAGLNSNGSFTYVPNANFNGVDHFSYRVSDGQTNSAVVTATITVTPTNDAPVVNIVNPTNGSVFIAPATFTVIAEATDVDGTVASVQIFAGTNLLSSFTNGPYLVLQTNLPAGIYNFFAIAIDNEGARSTSSIVSVTVTSNPPVTALGPIVLNRQNGLFEHFVRVSNPTPNDFPNGVRVFVFLPAGDMTNRVWNATGTNALGVPYVDSLTPLLAGGTVDVLIQYYLQSDRVVPAITLVAEPRPFTAAALAPPKLMSVSKIATGGMKVEFTSTRNLVYYLQCSDDLVHWKTISGLVRGTGDRLQCIDPASTPRQFYRVLAIR